MRGLLDQVIACFADAVCEGDLDRAERWLRVAVALSGHALGPSSPPDAFGAETMRAREGRDDA